MFYGENILISRLTIKNFRCFQDFTLDNIKPITLIAGANSVGKSTILESIFLFFDRYTSGVFIKLNSYRGMNILNLQPKTIWEPVFTNMNTDNDIHIYITRNGEDQSAIFSKESWFPLSSIPDIRLPINTQDLGMPVPDFYPLKLIYKDNTNEDISYFIITERGIIMSSPKHITAIPPYIHYISSKILTTPQQAAEWFSKVEMAGDKTKCIEILKLLDSRIRDLSVVLINGVAGLYADLGLTARLSINMLGDGINKLMQIVFIMLANPGAIILIDEMENGFHYSLYPKLWELIGILSNETKCQVFATTHSYECINGASTLTSNTNTSELFRFIRIDRNNDRIIPHIFDNDSFEYAVNNNWEIR